MNAIKNNYDVIIAGAGPTGLMLAIELKLQGVNVAVLERRPHGTTSESRAPGINSRTMEIFEMRGLANEFKSLGKPLPAVLFAGMLMQPKKFDPYWPDALILPQYQTERILKDYAKKLDVTFYWSTELIYFTQTEGKVDVVVKEEGEIQQFSAKYLAGCDGGRSVVRNIIGEPFHGEDPKSHWIVADVKLANPPAENERFGRNLKVGTYQISNVEGDWFRVSMMKILAPIDQRAKVTLEELRQTMLEGIGTDFGLESARWMSRFTDTFRQVSKYRFNRVFLLGDAAHTHSPIGGQGLNLGIQDAMNLGWKLAYTIKGIASQTLLDSFNNERHPVGTMILKMAKAQTALIKPNPQIEALRSVVSDMLEVPKVSMKICNTLSGLGISYAWGEKFHPLVGTRIPDMSLNVSRKEINLFSLMHKGKAVLLNFNKNESIKIPEKYQSEIELIQAVPQVETEENNWRLSSVGLVSPLENIFVRPDGFVAWVKTVDETFDKESFNKSIENYFS